MTPQIVLREYKDRDEFEKGARQMGRSNYELIEHAERRQRSRWLRIMLLGGLGALVWKPKPHIIAA